MTIHYDYIASAWWFELNHPRFGIRWKRGHLFPDSFFTKRGRWTRFGLRWFSDPRFIR